MTDYRKLDELMTNLEESSGQLAALTEVAEKVADLAQRQDDFVHELGHSIGQVNRAAVELNQLSLFAQSELLTGLAATRTTTDTGLKTINQALADGLDIGHRGLLTSLNQQADQLRTMQQDNRQFYADFEKLLRIKLGESTSEMRQLIEHERGQIKSLIDSQADVFLAKQQSLQTTLWIIGGVLISLVSAVLVKLYG